MLTVQAETRGRPATPLLRQAYADGILDGLAASSDIVNKVKYLLAYKMKDLFDKATVDKVIREVNSAVNYVMFESSQNPEVLSTSKELLEAQARRVENGGKRVFESPGKGDE